MIRSELNAVKIAMSVARFNILRGVAQCSRKIAEKTVFAPFHCLCRRPVDYKYVKQ